MRGHVDSALDRVFERHGLSPANFGVLVTLARIGGEEGVTQRRLMAELGLTSGTISVRMDRLVEEGFIERRPDPASRRSTRITLTARGREVFERVVPAHLANERRLLAALTDEEQEVLAGLLRKLLADFEGSEPCEGGAAPLGLTVAPAHVSMAMRESVGLEPVPALLVRAVDLVGPAGLAGVRTGDVLLRAGSRRLRTVAALYAALEEAEGDRLRLRVLRGTGEHQVTVTLRGTPGARAASPGRAGVGQHRL